jgi:hypothetical protein
MALTCSFRWQNSDATQNLNDRLRGLVSRGIYYGGDVHPGVGLQVTVDPFLAVGYDGMTIGETATTTLNVAALTTQYVVVRARYNPLGVPAAPTLYFQVLTAAQYAADAEINYLIVFAIVTPGPANVVLSQIDLSARDEITPVGRDWFRGVVANTGLLPVPPPTQNLIGDHYYVVAANTFYFWTGAIWSPMTTSGYNSETILNNRDLVDNEIQRLTNNSGLISGTRYGTPGFLGSKLELSVDGTPGIDDSIDIDTFAAVIYGHTIVTKATTLALPAHPVPAAPDRYDLVFLEVWREALAVPETYGYERNPTGALTYTLPQATDAAETAYTSGIAGTNFDFSTVGTYGHAGYVLKYRFGVKSGVANTAIYDPIMPVAGWVIPNVDATANFGTIANENRIWASTPAPSSIDDRTWAMPLLILRRYDGENFGASPIAIYRNGTRYIFPVHSVADIAKLGRDLAETAAVSDPLSVSLMDVGNPTLQPNEKPSGFITGMDYQVGPGVAASTLKFYDEVAKFRIRGFEDWTRFNVDEVDIGSPAVGAGNYARALVYIEMSITLHQDDDSDPVKKPNYYVSRVHRPLIPNYLLAGVVSDEGQGWRRGFVTYRVRALSFANLDYRDADDAMAAAGWSKGDNFLAGTDGQYLDGGLWSKTVALVTATDNRVHPFLTQWAIPVALVHRRNTAAWNYATNPNGSAGRPDGHTSATLIHPDDLVDLRCTVDIDEGTLAKQLNADFDRNMKGQLRTRMANKWSGAGTGGVVAGTRILQTDKISAINDVGAFWLSAPPDGCRMIWSDAKEFMPVCVSFALGLDYNPAGPSDADPATFLTAPETLKIGAPLGAHVIRHMPGAFVAGGSGSTYYLQYDGPPLWSTRWGFDRVTSPFPTASSAKVLKPGAGAFYTEESLEQQAVVGYMRFDVPDALDPGNPTMHDASSHVLSMEYTFSGPYPDPLDVATLSWWVHYDRNMTDARYANNFGLAEIPDVVHQVIQDPGGLAEEELHIGTLYTVVRKTTVPLQTWVEVTQADILAATGSPGTIRLLGIAYDNIRYPAAPLGAIASVIMPDAQDEIRITWAVAPFAAATDIDIIVFYETNPAIPGDPYVNQWVDIGRGGKSVMGPFCWHEEDVDLSALAADGPVAVPLGPVGSNYWWRHADVAGMLVEMPIVWQRTAPGASWYLVRLHRDNAWAAVPPANPQDPLSVGYPFSNVISLSSAWPNESTKPFLKIVVPRSNPTSTDILIHYTYTPYQGISSSGGAITNPIPAGTVTTDGLTRTKALLHGTVLHNTDWVVTQDGPCSKWGGVDSWTGWPTREPDRYLNFGYSAFADFNSPRLVRPNAQQGLQDTFGRNTTNTNAAAVLRMPFPGDAYDTNNYRQVHEYDLDPGREGASCGWFSYAPGYHSVMTVDMATPGNAVSLVLHDQFINGITPLDSRAFKAQEDGSFFLGSCEFHPTETNSGTTLYSPSGGPQYPEWSFAAGTAISVDGVLRCARNDVLCNTITQIDKWRVFDSMEIDGDPLTTCQLLMMSPTVAYGFGINTVAYNYLRGFEFRSWPNAWAAGGGAVLQKSALLCHGVGTIHMYYKSIMMDVQPLLHLYIIADAGGGTVSRTTYGTYAVVDKNRALTLGSNVNSEETPGLRLVKPLDTIVLPFATSGSRSTDYLTTTDDGAHRPNYYADSSSSSLVGMAVQYPYSWDPATVTAADALLHASETFNGAYNYGRGVYLRASHLGGSTYARSNMPVLVPGSGTPMNEVFRYTTLSNVAAESPPSIPTAPAESPFAKTHRRYDTYDHGGAIAYCGFGLHMIPSSNQYAGRVVMQISGGPLGQVRWPSTYEYNESAETPDETNTDGTALDAFWPTGRPVLKKR